MSGDISCATLGGNMPLLPVNIIQDRLPKFFLSVDIMPFFLLIAASVINMTIGSVSVSAATRTEQEQEYLGDITGVHTPSWAKRVHTLSHAEIPADRADVAHPSPPHDGDQLKQIIVYQRKGQPSYVVAAWRGNYGGLVSIDKVTKEGKLERAASLGDGEMVAIVDPSGQDVFPDHVPALFLDDASLGSSYQGYRHHILRLGDKVEDVTPPLRTLWADLHKGTLTAMSSDDRWGHFFLPCGQCGPLVPVISEWRDGRFHPVCNKYQEFLHAHLKLARKQASKTDDVIYNTADALLNATLLQLQLGQPKQARVSYQKLKGLLGSANTPANENREIRELDQSVTPLFAAVDKYQSTPCPLSAAADAIGANAHPAEKDRVDFFLGH